MRVDYNIRDKFNFEIFFSAIILISIGIIAIYSATINRTDVQANFERQVLWGCIAIIIFFITYSLPPNLFKSLSITTYLFSLLVLILVLFFGRKISGAKSWLFFGPIGFQPSEFAKIGTILALALFLSKKWVDVDSFKHIALYLIIGLIPVGLILLEPDVGTSLTFFAIILTMIFWKGISLFSLFVVLSPPFIAISSLFGINYFLGALALIAIALFLFKKDIFFSASIFAVNLGAGFFTDYVYNALSPHQQKRIQSFLDPMSDPLGAGYNTIQTKVAIGSGGFWGKGFLAGSQTGLQFIPQQWTDFIYSVIGEEFGFLGSIILLMVFLYLLTNILKIAYHSKDEFFSLTAIGILTVYFVHLIINVGMTIGLLPVIGIPLPFVSYGGSSLVANMFMLGIIANIYRTRKYYT